MTRALRAMAICTATAPTPPAPPSMNTVSPSLTPSRRSPRSDVSPATPAAPATAQSTAKGFLAHLASTASSCLGVLAATEDVVADGHIRDPVAHLVNHAGGVVAEVSRARQGLAPGHGSADQLPVDGVHARRPHRDADLPGARVRLRGLLPRQDLRTPISLVLQRSHGTSFRSEGPAP